MISEFTSGVELTLSNIDLRNYLSHDVSVFSAYANNKSKTITN